MNVPVLIFLLCLSRTSSAAGLDKRDAALQTFIIPITLDANQRYSVDVNMSNGPNPQSFSFALSTSTGYTVVAGSTCDSCDGVQAYDVSKSTTVQQTSESKSISLLGGAASGALVQENCTLKQSGGPGWVYPNQTIIVANQSDSIFTPGISGIFGLGSNGRDGDFSSTPFANWLGRNPSRTNFSYGMALNPPVNSSTDGGVLHWVLPDSSYYQGDISWKELSKLSSNSSLNSDWFVNMDGFSFHSGNSPNISRSGQELPTIIDPLFAAICFPQDEAKLIYGSVSGASIISTSAVSSVWGVPCDTKMTLAVTFGNLTATLDERVLVQEQGGNCFSLIEEWANPRVTEYLLGSIFISSVYLIFSMSNSTSSMGLADKATPALKSSISVAAIIGATLGSLSLAIMLIVAGVLIYRARQKKRQAILDERKTRPFTQDPMGYRGDDAIALLAGTPPITPNWRISSQSMVFSTESSAYTGPHSLGQSQNPHHLSVVEGREQLLLDSRSNSTTPGVDSPPPYIRHPTTDENHVMTFYQGSPVPMQVLPTLSPSPRKRRFES